MGRVAIIGVLFLALMVMAEATPIDIEEDNQYGRGRCSEELRGRRMHSCQRFLQSGGQGGGMMLPMIRPRGGQGEESLEDCCRELRRFDDRCRCQAIQRALEMAQRQPFQRDAEEYMDNESSMSMDRETMRRAENLPRMCRMDRPRRCQMTRDSYN